MNIVFRTDASLKIGSGHVMRCLTLAEGLKKFVSEITFISRAHEGNLNALIYKKGINVIELPETEDIELTIKKTKSYNYKEWLGVSQEQDAEETITALGHDRPDWLIVDHYGLDDAWEKSVRPHVVNIMVIDDLANRRHDCDILLDQNYSKNSLERYKGKIPIVSKRLLGPKFALLRPEYQNARQNLRIRNGKINRVLIYFGSSDTQNLTVKTLKAFNHLQLELIFLDVIIGVNQTNRKEIETFCNARGRTQYQNMLPDLASSMGEADLSIGAGGSSTWERLCLGLPSIVITTGENQEPASKALAQDGYHQYLGPAGKVTTKMLVDAIRFFVNSPKILERQSIHGKALVDGLGIQRVLKTLIIQ